MNIDFLLDNYRELNIVCLVGVSEGIFWQGGNGWRFFMIGGDVWKCILVVCGWINNLYRWAGVGGGMFWVVGK